MLYKMRICDFLNSLDNHPYAPTICQTCLQTPPSAYPPPLMPILPPTGPLMVKEIAKGIMVEFRKHGLGTYKAKP